MTPETRAILTAALERAGMEVKVLTRDANAYYVFGTMRNGRKKLKTMSAIRKRFETQKLRLSGRMGNGYRFLPMADFKPFTEDMRDAFPF